MKYLLLVASMALAVLGQLLMKKGVSTSMLEPNLNSIIKTIFNPFLFSGLVSYAISAIFWLFVLQKFPLSIAYPTLSLTYIVIVILSFFLFQEPITTQKIIGVLVIIFGVFILFR